LADGKCGFVDARALEKLEKQLQGESKDLFHFVLSQRPLEPEWIEIKFG
jgi:hypothetical protein